MTQLLSARDEKSNTVNTGRETMAEPGFARRSTFSRTLTFSPETYNRAVLQPLEGLQRTFTEIGMRIDPDAQMTNALIETYTKAAEGNEGDLPLQTGFARKAKFWKLLILLVAISCFMGLVASGFMNATENVSPHGSTRPCTDVCDACTCSTFSRVLTIPYSAEILTLLITSPPNRSPSSGRGATTRRT
jgi:hypothetical protein